jgi:hypothetical protein
MSKPAVTWEDILEIEAKYPFSAGPLPPRKRLVAGVARKRVLTSVPRPARKRVAVRS